MYTRISISRVSIQTISCDNSHFTMRICACSNKLNGSTDGEVAVYFLPQKIKLIRFGPHVDTGTFHRVLLRVRIVCGLALNGRIAYIGTIIEQSYFTYLLTKG